MKLTPSSCSRYPTPRRKHGQSAEHQLRAQQVDEFFLSGERCWENEINILLQGESFWFFNYPLLVMKPYQTRSWDIELREQSLESRSTGRISGGIVRPTHITNSSSLRSSFAQIGHASQRHFPPPTYRIKPHTKITLGNQERHQVCSISWHLC